MRPAEEIKKLIKNVPVETSARRDSEILNDVLSALDKSQKTQPAQQKPDIWRIIMKNNASKLAATIIIAAVVLAFFTFGRFSTSAWALSESIEALQKFNSVHMVGTIMDEYGSEKGCEIWMRANKSGTFSQDIVTRVTNGVIQWVDDGSTYTYIPQNNTVYHENAVTAGMNQWPGPAFLEIFENAENNQTIYGTDPATGRKFVTLMSSFIDSLGPKSYSIKFDVQSKLPISITQWTNMDRRGAPFFNAMQITYYENLPDSTFAVEYPQNAYQVEKELTIPESTIGLLSDPKSGILTEGLSKEEAARRIVRLLYEAAIDENLDEVRRLAPVCAGFSDKFLRIVLYGSNQNQRTEEILEILPICKEGHSKLGPIAAVPIISRRTDGTKVEDKIIVQFRYLEDKPSCVVQGPYGLPQELD